jgi:hypothetical protein
MALKSGLVLYFALFRAALSVTQDAVEVPIEWSELDSFTARSCNLHLQKKCEQEYKSCLQFSIPANDKITRCDCAGIFYGICLRQVVIFFMANNMLSLVSD